MNDEEAPRFSHSLRGYDRVQVDEYLAQSSQQLIELEDRAVAAESALVECRHELASPGSAGISQRLAAILQLANEEADDIRARARAEADATTQAAAQEAERTVKEASEQRERIQREIDELSTVREVLLQRLVELGDQIRDASDRFQGDPSGAAPAARADVELFDAEAAEGEAAIDDEPPTDPGADTDVVTSTGLTPDPS